MTHDAPRIEWHIKAYVDAMKANGCDVTEEIFDQEYRERLMLEATERSRLDAEKLGMKFEPSREKLSKVPFQKLELSR